MSFICMYRVSICALSFYAAIATPALAQPENTSSPVTISDDKVVFPGVDTNDAVTEEDLASSITAAPDDKVVFPGADTDDAAAVEDLASSITAIPSHAFSVFGSPRYAEDFTSFDYINPDAPKGGTLRLADIGTFDSLNPFILKGIADARSVLQFDTLLINGDDEIATAYGLLAESITVAKDNSYADFNIRDNAVFADGTPVTAHDAVFTFNILKKDGAPHFKTYYADVSAAEALNKHIVRFHFSDKENRELPLIVGQMNILPKHYLEGKDFTSLTEETIPGSGPYRIKTSEPGRRIVLERRSDYWGSNLAVNKGRHNFDSIIVDYYRDSNVAVEAFKAGEYDFRRENTAKNWATSYDIDKVKTGKLIKEEIPDGRPTGMQTFVLNSRLKKFSDPLTREALSYLMDFDWVNKHLFYNAYTRNRSYFGNSPYEAKGLPSEKELALLEPLKNKVPARVFTHSYEPPKADGSGRDRTMLRKARELLLKAGWTYKDKQWVHKDGETILDIEFLLVSPRFERVVSPIVTSMKKLGIPAKIRILDMPQYVSRLETFDFDIITYWFTQSAAPGNEQLNFWHSSQADVNGSKNYIGMKNPAADVLVEKLISAETFDDVQAAARALDRVLQWNFYTIPQWYSRSHRVIYANHLGRPEVTAPYALDYIGTWWFKQ